MARRAARAAVLDPERSYGPADLVVTTERARPPSPMEGPAERLPAREALYRIVLERGAVSLADLAQEVTGFSPGAARPPYTDDPELYLLRLIAGSRLRLPPLCDMQTIVRALAESPEPDPDYGFEVRPAK